MASRGFVTRMRMAFLEARHHLLDHSPTISAFLKRRSSRVMPGFRASPAVMTTMSEFAVSS